MPLSRDRLAHDPLSTVSVRRVDEVDAQVEGPFHYGYRVRLSGSARLAEAAVAAAAKAGHANAESRTTERREPRDSTFFHEPLVRRRRRQRANVR